MPPLPGQSTRTSAGDGAPPRPRARAGGEAAPDSSSGRDAPPRSTASGRSSTRQNSKEVLRVKLIRFYMIAGTIIRPMGRFMPVLEPLGDNLKSYSEEAADAWLELADEDPRVMEFIKSLTSVSAIGNVIGIHLAIAIEATPGGQMAAQAMNGVNQAVSTEQRLRESGMSPEEVAAAMALAQQMQSGPMPARDKSTGGPGDTIAVPPPVQYQPTKVEVPTAAPPVQQAHVVPKASIVSPEQLGVVIGGQQAGYGFSAAPPPQGRQAA